MSYRPSVFDAIVVAFILLSLWGVPILFWLKILTFDPRPRKTRHELTLENIERLELELGLGVPGLTPGASRQAIS
jgi:hypothetical protein